MMFIAFYLFCVIWCFIVTIRNCAKEFRFIDIGDVIMCLFVSIIPVWNAIIALQTTLDAYNLEDVIAKIIDHRIWEKK